MKQEQMFTKEEIENLSPNARVAFSARCAYQVLPLIGNEGHFDFWGEQAAYFIRAIEVCGFVVMQYAVSGSGVREGMVAKRAAAINAVNTAAINSANIAATDVFRAAFSVTLNIKTHAAAANAAVVQAVADAAKASGRAGIDVSMLHHAHREDYSLLLKNKSEIVEEAFFHYPLFPPQAAFTPETWITSEIGKAFQSVGCEDVLMRWQSAFEGNFSSLEERMHLIDGWYSEYQTRGTERDLRESFSDKKQQAPVSDSKPQSKSASVLGADEIGALLGKAESPESIADVEEQAASVSEAAQEMAEAKTGPVPPLEAEQAEAGIDEAATEAVEAEKDVHEPVYPYILNQGTPNCSIDEEATIDKLGREKLVKSLAAMFALPSQPTPFTIGLFGDWGAGKSSVMAQLQKELASSETRAKYPDFDFLFANFNVWEYEHTEKIRAGLAQEVINGLLTDGSYDEAAENKSKQLSWWHKFCLRWSFLYKDDPWQFLNLSLQVLVTSAGITFGIYSLSDEPKMMDGLLGSGSLGIGAYFLFRLFQQGKFLWDHPLATKVATYFKLPSYREQLGHIPVMKRQLKHLCDLLLSPGKQGWHKQTKKERRLVVFVDDLDRCKSTVIAETFDAIRLIMDIPRVIVIVAIDSRIAFKAMGKAYKEYEDLTLGRTQEDVARDYLGKIIQVPIQLSAPDADGLKMYVEQKLFPKENRRELTVPVEDSEAGIAEQRGTSHMPQMEGIDFDVSAESAEAGEPRSAEPTTLETQEAMAVAESAPTQFGPSDAEKKEVEVQQALMQETHYEVQWFLELAQVFSFTNPRQLLRLRNTYRLLKGLYPESESASVTLGMPAFHNGELQLLMMLFWQEFFMASKHDVIKKWWEQFRKQKVKGESVTQILQKDFCKQINWSSPQLVFKKEPYIGLAFFVKSCVLPQAAEVIAEQSRAD